MTKVIITRGGMYLDNRYNWGSIPDLFEQWHAPIVLRVMMDERNKQKPDGIALVDDSGVINLDALDVIRI